MTGRERFLTALNNQKPDRLPCQVHCWMQYYLDTYLNGMDQFEAYEYFGMDPVIYVSPIPIFDEKDLKNWRHTRKILSVKDGETSFLDLYETPEGTLSVKGAYNRFTTWDTEVMIKTEKDFELFKKYFPVPVSADWSPVINAKNRIKDSGIVRSCAHNYGQAGVWQSLCCLIGTEELIFKTFDEPDWVHYASNAIAEKLERTFYNMGKVESDLVETGGGHASSTVISPDMHKEFCLPYDQRVHKVLKEMGGRIVYHLCGGIMPLLETVTENGCDALETMTPASMGGDCRLKEAADRIGNKLAFIGGFDQNRGFEKGTKDYIQKSVRELFEAKPSGGLILSPSDHFFFGDPENVRTFVNACKECKY
ncbi:MAG: hypothetical protein IJY62_00095 [Clostridia bacterium]|nr:hypothetical protein [Clostridia bacterium]